MGGLIQTEGQFSILNFLVSCPRGTMFIKSVDASAYTKDAQLLCELLDGVIREIGLQFVVQVIMDNVANYVVARKLLMERYPTLYQNPCVARCIDLMLKGMGKLPWIKEIIDSALSVTIYIYICSFTHETIYKEQTCCVLRSNISPPASFLFGHSSRVCWSYKECLFFMSGFLVS